MHKIYNYLIELHNQNNRIANFIIQDIITYNFKSSKKEIEEYANSKYLFEIFSEILEYHFLFYIKHKDKNFNFLPLYFFDSHFIILEIVSFNKNDFFDSKCIIYKTSYNIESNKIVKIIDIIKNFQFGKIDENILIKLFDSSSP